MSDPVGDPTTAEFWRAASEGRLVVQRCQVCSSAQMYPRPFCLQCSSRDLSWSEVDGGGTVYSMTTVHLTSRDEIEPPVTLALVDLDAGPRLLGHLRGASAGIGDRVVLRWDGSMDESWPLMVFVPEGSGEEQP